jgi:hypothetical protein
MKLWKMQTCSRHSLALLKQIADGEIISQKKISFGEVWQH